MNKQRKIDEFFMRKSIEINWKGIKLGQTPFGAVIVKKGKIVAMTHNTVWKETNILLHGEINAIMAACKKLKKINLSGCTIYSTTEPCTMCFSACHWARIDRIVYGAAIPDAKVAGFNEVKISNRTMKRIGKSKIKITPGVLRKECIEQLKEWKRLKKCKNY